MHQQLDLDQLEEMALQQAFQAARSHTLAAEVEVALQAIQQQQAAQAAAVWVAFQVAEQVQARQTQAQAAAELALLVEISQAETADLAL
jgi:hypothetical protein